MLERDIQERYIGFVSGRDEISRPQTNPIRIYKELVHYRFEEVIRNAMPDFCDCLDKERLDSLIFDFIQIKPASPYVWQVPSLFMHYLLDFHLVDELSFASDLMWFESIEVDLLMGQYQKPKNEVFDWKKNFTLSPSMRMSILSHAVNRGLFDKIDEHPLLMYYHFDEHSVFFQEITVFMYRFLSLLEDMSPNEALASVCKEFDVNKEDVKELLEGALEEFARLNIIYLK